MIILLTLLIDTFEGDSPSKLVSRGPKIAYEVSIGANDAEVLKTWLVF